MSDIFFADSPSTLLDPTGKPYPQCWTEQVEVPPTEPEGEPSMETILKASRQAYPWAPAIIGTLSDGRNVYFELAADSTEYEQDGVFLARSYYELAALYPDIARHCSEAEYSLDSVPGRCKVADLPEGATVQGIYAPVKYLGVESPTEPAQPKDGLFPTQIREISQADAGIILMKDTVKAEAIVWIKANPNCTDYDLVAWIGAQYGEPYAGAAMAMLAIYVSGAYGKGLISEPTFEAFRDFVVATPVEELEAF